MNTNRWALGGVEYVFDPEQGKEVTQGNTRESRGRAQATIAQKTCVELAAAGCHGAAPRCGLNSIDI